MQSTKKPYGVVVRFVRALARRFCRMERICRGPVPAPSVLVCRHKNGNGPLKTLLMLEYDVRPWVLDVFCDRAACYAHYRDFTMTARFGWPRWFAVCMARLGSWIVPWLMRQMGAIAVYRGSPCAVMTLRETVRALEKGQRIILYPDRDYQDESSTAGALYEGYLILARMYERSTGTALAFVPVAAGKDYIITGEAIYACEGEARRQVGERMRAALGDLERGA